MSTNKYVILDKEILETLLQELTSLRQQVGELEQVVMATAGEIGKEKALLHQIAKIGQPLNQESILQTTVKEVRQLFNADRVAIFCFASDSCHQGKFVAEDVLPKWNSVLTQTFQELDNQDDSEYQLGNVKAIEDIYQAERSNYNLLMLTRFQVRAELVAPLYMGDRLWGLLCVHQCRDKRQWQGEEIEWVTQIAAQVGVTLQQAELLAEEQQRSAELEKKLAEQLQKQAEELATEEQQERILEQLIAKIQANLDIDEIIETTTEEARELLKCDRVAVHRFNRETETEITALFPLFPFLAHPKQSVAVDDVYKLLEEMQLRSYCVAPIFVSDLQWGLLVAYHNGERRRWEPKEIKFLTQIGNQLGLALQQAEAVKQLRMQSEQLAKTLEREKAVAAVIDKIRRSLDINVIFQTTVQEVRHLIKADRVAIYRFKPDWSGEFVVESVAEGWLSVFQQQIENPKLRQTINECSIKLLANPQIVDTYLQETRGGCYSRGERFRVVNDIYKSGFSDCYIEVIESIQAKAYAIIAIYQGQQLWGLLAAYQNSEPRHWEAADINFLVQIGSQLGVAVQQSELLRQAEQKSTVLETTLEAQLRQRANELAAETEREKAIAKVVENIRQTLDIDTIFQTTATEVRQLLNADRVAMVRFIPGTSYCESEFVAEAVLPEFASAIAAKVYDRCFGKNVSQYYQKGKIWAANDIYEMGLPDCHLAILSRFQVRANLVVPLLKGEELWGLLCIHQCSGSRQWQEKEIEFVTHIAVQLGVALQQAKLLKQAQNQSEELQALLTQVQAQKEQQGKIAERERAFARMIERIRLSLDINVIFRVTTSEVRQILKCDRVVFYQFKPDWDGEFVFESVAEGWIPFVQENHNVGWVDSYMQETAAGRFRNHENAAVNNIYQAGLTECHIEILSKFKIKAYIVVPVFVGEKLWGLLGAYQHSAPRHWEPIDVSLLTQLGNQLGVALQQAELLAQLKKAKETADAANRAKSDFLAHMSHELRTPLNAILGFTQLMSRDNSLNFDQQENLSIINRSGEHLLTLINDVLEMSKIEAGQTTLHENSFDLYRLLDSIQEMLEIKAAEKSLQLIFERPTNLPQFICTDESKLRQVLINLLGNAIKFTQQGIVILRVSVVSSQFCPVNSTEQLTLQFEIEDTGPGIAPEEINNLFEPFAQTETGRKSQEGTGLGLPISRKFVKLMGGDISVTSTVGIGTIFNFHIQVKPGESSAIQPVKIEQRIIGLAPGQRNYRILVVEDKWANRQLLVQLLLPLGFEVKEAADGQEAIALLESWSPDLIWMDMRMPVMDGYAATKAIRAKNWTKPPIIIALTANAFEEERMIALSIGCDDFVRKPFQENTILEKIAEYLGVRYIYAEQSQQSSILYDESKELSITNYPSPITNLRILLADDNHFNQKLASGMLKQLGYEADVASSGVEVLEAMHCNSYDVVLMDMKMPFMDGVETTRRIYQEWVDGERPRIIAMTASTLESDRQECLAAGMEDYITKPIRLEDLKAALSRCQPINLKDSNSMQQYTDLGSILDRDAIENLRSAVLDDADGFLRDMINGYLTEAPGLMQSIREAIAQPDPAKLDIVAHTLKSMSATFGANTFAELCKQLENMGRSGAIAFSPEQLAQLETEYQRVVAALELERQQLQFDC
jgi:GAF domain-containing protein/DNA-binding response OmpR family regulator/HPt (histidine-containing phosphotransfer) domain-containing protein